MQYRTLGKTNLRVSVVGIGTWQYGGEWGMEFNQPTVDAIFDKGRELGVNLIDTAECYGDHTSEAFVGNAIQRDRDKWIPEEGGAGSVFTTAKNQNLGILARVPLASGLLSGKYKPGAVFPEGDVRAKWKDPNLDTKLEQVQQIARTEVPPGVDMAAWALAWCLKNPVVTSVIPGCKNAGQLEQNARASELNLRPDSGPAPTAATQSLF